MPRLVGTGVVTLCSVLVLSVALRQQKKPSSRSLWKSPRGQQPSTQAKRLSVLIVPFFFFSRRNTCHIRHCKWIDRQTLNEEEEEKKKKKTKKKRRTYSSLSRSALLGQHVGVENKMRQRTKSVVNVREYFRTDGSGAPEQEDDDDADDWMPLALQGGARSSSCPRDPEGSFDMVKLRKTTRARTCTCDSLADTDEDTDDDEDDDGILCIRACSHDRRISFQEDVNVVEIPARSSFDADYKRRVWYSRDELRRTQECC